MTEYDFLRKQLLQNKQTIMTLMALIVSTETMLQPEIEQLIFIRNRIIAENLRPIRARMNAIRKSVAQDEEAREEIVIKMPLTSYATEI